MRRIETMKLLIRNIISGSRAALLISALSLGIPTTCAAQADLDAAQRTRIFDDVTAILGFAEGGSGIVAVGEPSIAKQGQETVLYAVKPGLALSSLGVVKPPAPPKGIRILSTSARGILNLREGGYVVFGAVEVGTPRQGNTSGARRFEGWAARIRSDGETIWSQIWPEPSSELNQELFYFGYETGNGNLVLGGKRQKGSACADPSKAVLLWADLETGKISSPGGQAAPARRYYGDAGRQGFRAAAIGGDGTLNVTGWSGKSTLSGECPDHPLVGVITAAGELKSWHVISGMPGDLIAVASTGLGGHIGAGNRLQAERGTHAAQSLSFVPWSEPKIIGQSRLMVSGRPLGKLTAATALARGAGLITAGRTGVGGADAAPAWLHVQSEDGLCLGSTEIALSASKYSDIEPQAVLHGEYGNILVGGTAIDSTAKKRVAWLSLYQAAITQAHSENKVGNIAPKYSLFQVFNLGDEQSAGISFELTQPALLRAILYPVVHDSDLILLNSENAAIALSDNEADATEVIEATLPPARYRIVGVAGSAGALAHLRLEIGDAASDQTQTAVLLTHVLSGASDSRRQLAIEDLAAMGFSSGQSEPEIGLAARSQRAIKSFQASMCDVVSGDLTAEQALEISARRGKMAFAHYMHNRAPAISRRWLSLPNSPIEIEAEVPGGPAQDRTTIAAGDIEGSIAVWGGAEQYSWIGEMSKGVLTDWATGSAKDGPLFVGHIYPIYAENGTLIDVKPSHGLMYFPDGRMQSIGSLGDAIDLAKRRERICRFCSLTPSRAENSR